MLLQRLDNIYPSDHIISIGNICNGSCIYCAQNACKSKSKWCVLSLRKGFEIIDFILSSPTKYIYVEFTGGEPLLIIDRLSEIIEYFKKNSKEKGKEIHISLVSNLQRFDEKEMRFVLKNKITLCTSLDGPEELHNYQRRGLKNSYSNVSNALRILNYYASKGLIEEPNVITTVTKHSLPFYKEIIGEYLKHNIRRIQLGIVEPIGRAKKIWNDIGLTSDEYISFYDKALEEIFKINRDKKIYVYEKGFFLLLKSIIDGTLYRKRSIPIVNRLSYDEMGYVYPDDESRMIDEKEVFRICNVNIKDIKKAIKTEEAKRILKYSVCNNYDPVCNKCKYSKWCYIPLWHRYISLNNLEKPSATDKCKIFRHVFDIIFYVKKNHIYRKIIQNWLDIHHG